MKLAILSRNSQLYSTRRLKEAAGALSEAVLRGLVEHLSVSTSAADGRTYAGGLTKFEPREMERLLVPPPELLTGGAQ
jgi:hypothetical protein